MARTNLNYVMITGNLTADPELRETGSGISVCEMRIANNTAVKKDGEWTARTNFFQANAWGKLGDNCAKYLAKGSSVVVEGKLEWQQWDNAKEPGKKNSRVLINVKSIEFTGKPKGKPDTDADQTSMEDDIPF